MAVTSIASSSPALVMLPATAFKRGSPTSCPEMRDLLWARARTF
jgi:hypothetical protein